MLTANGSLHTTGIPFPHLAFRIRIERMMTENLDETHPTPVGDETQSIPVEGEFNGVEEPLQETEAPTKPRRVHWFWWVLLFIAGLVLVAGISGYVAYQQGIAERVNLESTQMAMAVGDQFDLALQDMDAGRYEIAEQRLVYIIDLDPNFPGVIDKLAEVRVILNITATPTLVPPTATTTPVPVTPTPDFRGEAELFAQAEDLIRNLEWSEAIETLETLRKKNPEYNAIDVDGMMYISYRQRGVQKIGLGNLEGGIYDLNLAERFGILDTQADSQRTWAQYYIRGASFWEIDWGQAVYYFEQVAPQYPNMHDGSGWFASQRYYEALIEYAEWYEVQEKWCRAEEQYIKAYEYTGNESLVETIDIIADKCR